tara:strand:- start:538 stop:909 length:372 start_codon:yes stop_codon:yes gene_type:complete
MYIVLSQILNKKFSLGSRTIFVNVILIAALLCLFIYPNEIMKPKLNKKYIIIITIGIILFLQNYLLQLGTESNTNMGLIDGFSVSLYLPLVTLIMIYYFKEKINNKKILGIFLVSLSVYLILS